MQKLQQRIAVSVVEGRKRVRRGVRRPIDGWDVLIKDHHAAYTTWDEFECNVKAIANNATGMSSALSRGAARKGELLLPELLCCGHCDSMCTTAASSVAITAMARA